MHRDSRGIAAMLDVLVVASPEAEVLDRRLVDLKLRQGPEGIPVSAAPHDRLVFETATAHQSRFKLLIELLVGGRLEFLNVLRVRHSLQLHRVVELVRYEVKLLKFVLLLANLPVLLQLLFRRSDWVRVLAAIVRFLTDGHLELLLEFSALVTGHFR